MTQDGCSLRSSQIDFGRFVLCALARDVEGFHQTRFVDHALVEPSVGPKRSMSTRGSHYLQKNRLPDHLCGRSCAPSLTSKGMSEVTQILNAIRQGDQQASAELLPLVYEELRKLAAQKLAQEKPGQTLQATALVHEAYLRLVGK